MSQQGRGRGEAGILKALSEFTGLSYRGCELDRGRKNSDLTILIFLVLGRLVALHMFPQLLVSLCRDRDP